MSDWQNIMSMDGDYSPWDSPCWNDDWEHELRDDGYMTVQEWNKRGKNVTKGAKGRFLPCARITVFEESQTEPSPQTARRPTQSTTLHFGTFGEAMTWAKANPGQSITRSPDGEGFIAKQPFRLLGSVDTTTSF